MLAGQGAHLKTFHIPLLLIFPKQPAPFLLYVSHDEASNATYHAGGEHKKDCQAVTRSGYGSSRKRALFPIKSLDFLIEDMLNVSYPAG